MKPTHLVRVEKGPDQALYPANGIVGLRRVMRALQKQGFRTKVFTWSNKARAYLS